MSKLARVQSTGTRKAEILLIATHHPLGHLYIGKEHPELELKASLRKRMCVHIALTGKLVTGVCLCVCAGNHCWPDFLFFYRKQNGGVWEVWNNAVKVCTTQVMEQGSCESEGSARSSARPISASGTMC